MDKPDPQMVPVVLRDLPWKPWTGFNVEGEVLVLFRAPSKLGKYYLAVSACCVVISKDAPAELAFAEFLPVSEKTAEFYVPLWSQKELDERK